MSDSTVKPWDLRMIAVAFAGFCTFLDLYATQSLLPLLRQYFHASAVQVSLTISATTLAVALAAPIIGVLADRIGRKRVIVTAILGLAPTFLAATSQSLTALIGWRFLQGLFMPGIFAVTMAYISEEWAEGGAGTVMAGYVTGNVIGGFCGRFLSALMAAHFSWRIAFVALGVLNLLGGLVVWRRLPLERRFVAERNWRASAEAMGRHLRNPLLLATYAVGFNVLFSLVGIFTYINFHLAAPPFNLSTTALGSLFLVYLLGMVVTPIAGRWIDRIGYKRVLIAGLGVSCLGVVLTLGWTLWLEVAGLALCSSGIFACQSAATSYVGVAAGKGRSSAAGLYVTFYYIGGSVGAVLPGLFWTRGGWPACVSLIAVVELATAAIALAFWRDGKGPIVIAAAD